jgi:hypothetical protein
MNSLRFEGESIAEAALFIDKTENMSRIRWDTKYQWQGLFLNLGYGDCVEEGEKKEQNERSVIREKQVDVLVPPSIQHSF